ncbi:hypothetical protein [Neptuniibacter sp. QD37_11]|uniref:hypothetical protein n=1 Tax=Neptuniibacter sp. QD37_11 TaxID=3398209 RepID=UPI0039F47DDA
MRDLINASTEFLIKHESPEYVATSEQLHSIKDALVPTLKDASNACLDDGAKTVVQALFESGFLTTDDRDSNLRHLLQYIYGVKLHESMEPFLVLHKQLTEHGFTSEENSFNASGDNYYCALDSKETCTEGQPLRKAIYVENQSPAYLLVIDRARQGKFHIVRLRASHKDPSKLTKFIEADFKDVEKLCTGGGPFDLNRCKMVTTLDVSKMECDFATEPSLIDNALFNIHSGICSIEEY